MALGPGDAVLLVAYGTASNLDDLPEFVRRVRGGRPASETRVSELRRRYERVGGSPLLEITRAQGAALQEALGIEVLVAMRHWHPTLSEVLQKTPVTESRRLCVLPLAPFNADTYCDAADQALQSVRARLARAPSLVRVGPWGTEPGFVGAWASSIQQQSELGSDDTALLLSAHSVPTGLGEAAERYQQQVADCAAAIRERVGRKPELCFQSQVSDGRDWIGPDLRSTLASVKERGQRHVILAPIGFLAEHLETLYDLDIEAASWANKLGLVFRRLPALGVDAGLIETLAGLVRRALE